MPNRSDPDHFYSAPEARRYIDNNNVSFEKLKSFIPNTKEASEEKKAVNQSKLLDKGKKISARKLRATIGCDNCGAEHGFYSNFGVGTKKGPSKAQLNNLIASLENGYICDNAIKGDGGLFVGRQQRCGDHIESQYYNPKTGVLGRHIVMEDICAICYEREDIGQADEIRKKQNIGRKNPILVCQYFFDKKFEIPYCGG